MGCFTAWLGCSDVEKLLYCLVLSCFAAAAVMDLQEQCVYRYIWYLAAGFLVPILYRREIQVWSLIGYALLQETLFSCFYGRADCHGFVAAGLFLYSVGGNFQSCIIHMGITFLEVFVVQLCKGNINARGNLKQPVALIPYLVTALQMMLPGFV